MLNLQTLLQAIETLSADELEQIHTRIEERRRDLQQAHPPAESVKEWMAKLDVALEHFWEGMSQSEIEETIQAMNTEYIEPEDPEVFDWLDKLPEDKR
jgi:predicted  nucleic acid-binding Zn-ribbon protein